MRFLFFIFLLFGSLSLESQEKKHESSLTKTTVTSEKILYDLYASKTSNRLYAQRKSFQAPIIIDNEYPLSYINGYSKNLKVNKDELIEILTKYAKHGIKRELEKDYKIGFNFYINKVTY